MSARCEPRLECATAWISSTITACTEVSIERAWEVRIRYSDSGVVIRMSGGLRAIAARSRCGVSPVRMPTLTASAPIPRRGALRFRSMSYASAFSGLTYSTRVPAPRGAGPSLWRRSSAHRNAASVLPEPVGADSSTCSPAAIAGHAWACAGVGSAKARANHSRTPGLKLERGITRGYRARLIHFR